MCMRFMYGISTSCTQEKLLWFIHISCGFGSRTVLISRWEREPDLRNDQLATAWGLRVQMKVSKTRLGWSGRLKRMPERMPTVRSLPANDANISGRWRLRSFGRRSVYSYSWRIWSSSVLPPPIQGRNERAKRTGSSCTPYRLSKPWGSEQTSFVHHDHPS